MILSAAMTLDGKIATRRGGGQISCPEDKERVHRLRSQVDAIMVGKGTILTDDPKLTSQLKGGKNPIRVVVDAAAETPVGARVLTVSPGTKTIIAVTNRAPEEKIYALRRAGAEVVKVGEGGRVDLKMLMLLLRERGVERLMLEGGGGLNWSMLREGLVDEVRVALAPLIFGGEGAKTLVEGEGVASVEEGFKLRLKGVERVGEDLVLSYDVLRGGG